MASSVVVDVPFDLYIVKVFNTPSISKLSSSEVYVEPTGSKHPVE
jgi:hypothetical protein